ncbi:hypothetical protein QTI24_10440 [Variovorax sp. J22P240]|uniref:hypothetical protein n=1 Tax=Variovorax sp. J22P240 TaxID=3053514 RepID=UPI0025765B72|nr:hypothetical protein [Variovorax sp. J22P240]MDL9999021.1 hypothetical protein [Variovorax sp. J22P240]
MYKFLKIFARPLAALRQSGTQVASEPGIPSAGVRASSPRHLADIREIVGQMSESLGARLKAAGIAMDLRIPSDPLTVFLDRSGMQEVFTQVADLACRIMPAGGTLQLLARADGAHAVINFMDQAPAEEPRLGRCFSAALARRDDAAHAQSIDGVKLCEQIVSDNGGRIYAAPSPLGSLGVTLRLPLC